MNATSKKAGRFLPLAVAAAIIGVGLASTIHTDHSDAALKWNEHVVKWNIKENNGHDDNKDGLKFVNPTPAPDTTTTP